MNSHFNSCHIRLSPPIKTIDNFEKIFLTILYCHGISLLWLYHLEISKFCLKNTIDEQHFQINQVFDWY